MFFIDIFVIIVSASGLGHRSNQGTAQGDNNVSSVGLIKESDPCNKLAVSEGRPLELLQERCHTYFIGGSSHSEQTSPERSFFSKCLQSQSLCLRSLFRLLLTLSDFCTYIDVRNHETVATPVRIYTYTDFAIEIWGFNRRLTKILFKIQDSLLIKHCKTTLLLPLHDVLCQCWQEGAVPQDIRDSKIITLYKNKGERIDCNNYRGISLLSIVGKVFARVILIRLQKLAERIYPESQCGFRAERQQ